MVGFAVLPFFLSFLHFSTTHSLDESRLKPNLNGHRDILQHRVHLLHGGEGRGVMGQATAQVSWAPIRAASEQGPVLLLECSLSHF